MVNGAMNPKRLKKKLTLLDELHIFYFLLSRESVLFRLNFRSGDFDGFTRFEVS